MTKKSIPQGQGNRGVLMERIVTGSLDLMAPDLGYWQPSPPVTILKNLPNGAFIGKRTGYGPLDFVGDWRGHALYLDAKQTGEKRLAFDLLRPHQVDIIRDRFAQNALAAFLVGFLDLWPQRFFLVPWPVLEPYWEPWATSIKGEKVRASIPLEELERRAIAVPTRGLFLDLEPALTWLDALLPYNNGGTPRHRAP